MRRTVVVTGAAAALLGPAVGVASASGAPVLRGGQSRTVSAAPGPAAAQARAAGWTVVQSPSPGSHDNVLESVAATSATNAWAVGYTNGTAQALILHWNGTAWEQQSSPSPGAHSNILTGVAATSPTNAWAVGYYNTGTGTPDQTLILHWNGTAWKQQSSPNPAAKNENVLSGVAATSATNAWAVGRYIGRTNEDHALIVHWNGIAWKQVASPSLSSGSVLRAVAATSATNVWAVGDSELPEGLQALIEHWTGTAWKQVPAPAFSHRNVVLYGVSATSASNAWAVGTHCGGCSGGQAPGALTLHWNGTAWKQQSSPSPGGNSDQMEGVAATSATNAWAVGFSSTPLIVHWNGAAWTQQSSPNPNAGLYGVAATSATNAWAVGAYLKGGISHTLTLHCC